MIKLAPYTKEDKAPITPPNEIDRDKRLKQQKQLYLGSALAASFASIATTLAFTTIGAAYLAPATFSSPTFVSASLATRAG